MLVKKGRLILGPTSDEALSHLVGHAEMNATPAAKEDRASVGEAR